MKIIMGEWLMNAGIIGYIRIQKAARIEIPIIDKRYIEIKKEDLENFSHRYFSYALEQHMKKQFTVYSILTKLTKLDKKIIWQLTSKIKNEGDRIIDQYKLDYNDFDRSIEICIKQLSIFQEKSIEIIRSELNSEIPQRNIEKLEEKIKNVFLEKQEKLKDDGMQFIVTFFQKFYFNKNIIGNPSKRKNTKRHVLFEKEYVESARNQLKSSALNIGVVCKFCKTNTVKIKNFDTSVFTEGIFSPTTVSVMKFKNFFYNMQSDLFMCDVCELLFLCAWAGLNEIPYQARNRINGKESDTNYLFVNIPSLELTYEENEKIDKQYKQSLERLEGTIYENVINDVFLHQQKAKSVWIIQNISFIEIKTVSRKDIDRPNYLYFHIGKDVARLFHDSFAINAFKNIQGKIDLTNRMEVNLGREVISRILKHEPLLPLCCYILHAHLDKREPQLPDKVFNVSLIFSIYNVILSGDTVLKSNQVFGILNNLREEGSKFRNIAYERRKSRSYALLSMIRNKRIDAFYDMVVKMYMSENRSIPESLVAIFNPKDEIDFQSRAYAFMSGFLNNTKLQKEVEIA